MSDCTVLVISARLSRAEVVDRSLEVYEVSLWARPFSEVRRLGTIHMSGSAAFDTAFSLFE